MLQTANAELRAAEDRVGPRPLEVRIEAVRERPFDTPSVVCMGPVRITR